MSDKGSLARRFTDEGGSVLIAGVLGVLAVTLIGIGLFESGLVEMRLAAESAADVRAFYAAETGLNRGALDVANDGAAVLSPVSPNPTFDSIKGGPLPFLLYASTCFGSTSCDSSNNPGNPAYTVQAVNHADPDKLWLVSTSCVPGPAASPCPAGSTAVAQVKALIRKTVTTTTTTSTTTIPEFGWGAFGANFATVSGGTFDSYDSHACTPSPCNYGASLPGGGTNVGTGMMLGSNGSIDTSGTVTIGGSVIGTTDVATDPSDLNLPSGTTVTGGTVQSGGTIVIGGVTNPATSSQVDGGAAGMIKPNTSTPAPTLSALPNCSPYPASSPVTQTNPGTGSCSYTPATGALNIQSGAKCQLNPGSYCLGSINVQNNGSELQISGQTVVTVNGFFQVQSSGAINNTTHDPQNFQLISTYGNDAGETDVNHAVLINSASVSYMTVYAPTAAVKFQGGATLYGAIIGQSLSTSGNSVIHYDTFLGSGNANLASGISVTTTTITTIPGPTTYSLLSWQSCRFSNGSWDCS
jgi:Tfp pilus assembly protein PilX